MAQPAGSTMINGVAVSADGAVYVTLDPASSLTVVSLSATNFFSAPLMVADRLSMNSANQDAQMVRATTNSILFGGAGAIVAGASTSRTEMNKGVSAIPDATPTAVFTITVPNAAHCASIMVRLLARLGAGGAIGADEATATISYIISVNRTAGVNAVAGISAAFGSASSAVAGAATVTVTAAMSAVSGAVGATNTFTVNATITKSGGASANHNCTCYGQLLNANTSGITLA